MLRVLYNFQSSVYKRKESSVCNLFRKSSTIARTRMPAEYLDLLENQKQQCLLREQYICLVLYCCS